MAAAGSARKRERENPCGICGHYHKYEEGEACGICGHRMPAASDRSPIQVSAFATEILPEFLFLGSYDNASRSELLKTQGISRILNTVPSCTNLYRNSFTYYSLKDDKSYPFDDAVQFIEQCERDRAPVLVHCMTGKSRSPAIVIAYLMKSKQWRLAQSCQWVKDCRPSVEIHQDVYQHLLEYEQHIFSAGDTNSSSSTLNLSPHTDSTLSFGFPKAEAVAVPKFGVEPATSIFNLSLNNVPPNEFTFGAADKPNPNPGDISMDGT